MVRISSLALRRLVLFLLVYVTLQSSASDRWPAHGPLWPFKNDTNNSNRVDLWRAPDGRHMAAADGQMPQTTAAPPEFAVKLFVIFTTARSGSGWTIRMLDSHRKISCQNREPLGQIFDKYVRRE